MTTQQKARKAYIDLWLEFYTAKTQQEKDSLLISLGFLQGLCAPTLIEFNKWACTSVAFYRQYWEEQVRLRTINEHLNEMPPGS